MRLNEPTQIGVVRLLSSISTSWYLLATAAVSAMSTPSYLSDVCQQANHMSAIWENKIYALGGYNVISRDGSSSGTPVTNSYLRILDFTKSLDFTTDNITTLKRMPDEVPRTKWASVWADDGKVYLFGGEYELYQELNADGIGLNTTRPALSGTVWEYDIAGDSWTGIPDSSNSIQSIVRAQSAFDSSGKTQYFLAGALEEGQYYLGNGSFLPAATPPVVSLSNLVTFNMDTQVWTNKTNDISLGSVQQGQMVYFEPLGAKGALVVLGGWEDSVTPRPMSSINLYDIATSTWYTQTATAETGNFPVSRREFCVVPVSATDGTSHNIYVYGGVDQDHENTVDTALNDVWILTLPYFRWVNAGRAPIGKEALSCNLLSERYMVAYRGRNGESTNDFVACDQSSTPEVIQGLNIFDLTSLNWTTQYVHPTGTPTYQVPEKLYNIIGGNANGDANITTPKDGFVDDKLAAIFEAAIARSSSTPSSSTPSSTQTTSTGENGSAPTTPVGAIAGGVVGGVLVLAAILGFLFWRRRKNRAPRADVSELSSTNLMSAELSGASTVSPKYEMPVVEPVQLPVEMDAVATTRKPVPHKFLPGEINQ